VPEKEKKRVKGRPLKKEKSCPPDQNIDVHRLREKEKGEEI